MDRYSFRAAARIVTVSNDFKRRLVHRGMPEERITVLYNAVKTPSGMSRSTPRCSARNKRALGISGEEKVVVAVGRLSREKGQIDLVFALNHLRRVRPDMTVRVVLVGEGTDRPKILQAAESLGLANWITLAGHQHNVAPYYEAADVVAIPSYSEGSPNVLLEAMASNIPVVATSVGGIPEIVTHTRGDRTLGSAEPDRTHGIGDRSSPLECQPGGEPGATGTRNGGEGLLSRISCPRFAADLRRRASGRNGRIFTQ